MFDRNEFKRKVKEWIRANPLGSEQDLLDVCDELVPANQFAANQWLVEQTISWYRHIIEHREKFKKMIADANEADEI